MAPSTYVFALSALLNLLPIALGQQAAAVAYAPSSAPCPSDVDLVRNVGLIQALNVNEEAYISTRDSKVLPQAWADYLSNVQANARLSRVALPSYVTSILGGRNPSRFPRLAITASGGGYRAAIFSAGVFNALDGRNGTSTHAGTGGLLQGASYISGLSGGSWFLSSLMQANFPTMYELTLGSSSASAAGGYGGWVANIDLLQPSADPQLMEEFIGLLLEEVALKAMTGFPVTATDIWGRSLARHFANGTTATDFFNGNLTHGAGITLSGLVELPGFQRHAVPYPIIVTDSVSKYAKNDTSGSMPGETVPLTNPIYEFSPFEMGSFDPMLAAFTPTKYLGSTRDSCVTNYDQIGWVAGASSDLFNTFNTSDSALAASPVGPIIAAVNATFPSRGVELDAAAVPNPFYGVAPKTYMDSNQTMLALVDGGDDGEVSPLQPMLVKSRAIDVIFVVDAAGGTEDNYSDGTSLIASSRRASYYPHSYSFPPVPASATAFESQGLTKRPTFFGCNSGLHAPLIIYVANGAAPLGQASYTNTSTWQYAYQNAQIQAMMDQAFDIATQGIPQAGSHGPHFAPVGFEKDPLWPVCLACGVVDRARSKLGVPRSGVCAQCMARYCWS